MYWAKQFVDEQFERELFYEELFEEGQRGLPRFTAHGRMQTYANRKWRSCLKKEV